MTDPAPLPLRLVLRVANGTASQSDIERFDAWHGENATRTARATDAEQRLREKVARRQREKAEEDVVLEILSDAAIERLLHALREGPDDPFADLGARADISDLVAAIDDPDPELVLGILSPCRSGEGAARAQLYCVEQLVPCDRSRDLSAYQQDFLSDIIQEYLVLIWSLQQTRPDRAA